MAQPTHSREQPPLNARDAAEVAKEYITELNGQDPVAMTSMEFTDQDGWVVGFEVVEDRRIPPRRTSWRCTKSNWTPTENCWGFRRTRRYRRAQTMSGCGPVSIVSSKVMGNAVQSQREPRSTRMSADGYMRPSAAVTPRVAYPACATSPFADKARAHDAVITAVAQSGSVIPVRMATVYLDDRHVRTLLENRCHDFEATLSRLCGRAELGVKVYADPKRLLTPDKEQNHDGMRTGTAYLMRRKQELASHEEAYRGGRHRG